MNHFWLEENKLKPWDFKNKKNETENRNGTNHKRFCMIFSFNNNAVEYKIIDILSTVQIQGRQIELTAQHNQEYLYFLQFVVDSRWNGIYMCPIR